MAKNVVTTKPWNELLPPTPTHCQSLRGENQAGLSSSVWPALAVENQHGSARLHLLTILSIRIRASAVRSGASVIFGTWAGTVSKVRMQG